jgi:Protein kinase domain
LTAPKVIGPYEILDLLGRGGMGEVYKAVDERMYRRPVALKLLSEAMGADPRAASRFDQEVETAANLRHPNIVQIYDRGEHEGRRYFAMEFLEGHDLSAVIKARGDWTLEARLELVLQLCDALDYAHAQGVVHRDIKPANIMVLSSGGSEHVKLLDFGIAHVTRSDHTKTVIQPGTLLYMSPEQLKDEPVSAASDLFSLGIVIYELCSGVHPFKARTEYLASSNIMFEKHPPLRTHEPSVPEDLERVLDRLLDKDPSQRPASAGEAAGELRKIVRQMRALEADPDAPTLDNLDEMTGPMVERIVHWARTKETEGAISEALEAYKRAILLAPAASWLQARVAKLGEQLRDAPTEDGAMADDAGRGTTSRNREREHFVQEQMAAAELALDEGDLDRASSIAAAMLRKYPDDEHALALIDRVVLITDRGVPVKAYRREIKAARQALAGGDIPGARRSCEAATAIWPDDDEVITLGREIEKVRQVELAKALKASDDILARAVGSGGDEGPPASTIAEARSVLEQALRLGADDASIARRREAVDAIEREAASRRAARASRDREAESARRAEIAARLEEARGLVEAAIAEAEAALAGARQAEAAAERVRALGAAPADTDGLRERVAAAVRSLEGTIATLAAAERERSTRLEAVRRGLKEAEGLIDGPPDDLTRAGGLLRSLTEDLARAAGQGPETPALRDLRAEAESLGAKLHSRRRAEDERIAREQKEKREREEKERRERAAADRAKREEVERAEREEAERARGEEAGRRKLDAAERAKRDEAERAAAEQRKREAAERAKRQEALRREREEEERAKRAEADGQKREAAERRKREKAEAKANAARARQAAVAPEAAAVAPVAPRSGLLKWGGLAAGALVVVAGLVYTLSSHRAPAVATPAAPALASEETSTSTAVVPPPQVAPPAVEPPSVTEASSVPKPTMPDFTGRIDQARRALREAGNAPMAPAAKVQSAIDVADRGIATCQGILAEDRGQADAKTLLAQLEQTREVLIRRKDALEASQHPEPPALKAPAPEVASAPPPKLPVSPPVAALAPPPAAASPREAAETLIAEAQGQPLSSREGLNKRIEADRQALQKLGPMSGESWAKDAAHAVQRDLETAAVWDLFYRYREAVQRRDVAAIAAVWPSYPKASAENLQRAKAFEYSFADLKIAPDGKSAVVRQTTRQKMDANYWADPIKATVRYNLEKRPDGSFIIRSAAAER